jgi:hypothetical protein
MNRLLALAAVMALFSCGPCAAQQGGFGAPPTPGSGTTSPLGAIVTTSPVGGSGIGLGLSDVSVVGLSPLPAAPIGGGSGCPDPITSNSMPAPTFAGFDTSGPTGVAALPPGCVATTIGGVNLAAGLSNVPGSIAVSNYASTYLGAPTIALGATDQGYAGLSPLSPAQALNVSGSSAVIGAPVVSLGTTNPSAAGLSPPPVTQARSCPSLVGFSSSPSSTAIVPGGLVTILTLGC